MKNRILSLILILSFFAPFTAKADEGMWLPMLVKRLNESDMQKEGCKLTAEEIYDINNASLKDAIVSFGGFCTGEIISDQGLILTNHHCGYDAIRAASSVESDYLTNGFWAFSKDQEIPATGLFVKFLVRMEDVTEKVKAGLTDDLKGPARAAKLTDLYNAIKAEAVKETHYNAEVKPLFAGNAYYLFVYETFNDIRIVGAPPEAVGKFGGDTDNWMWPRHTGDFAMFRVYASADGKPAKYSKDNSPLKPRHFLPISVSGVKKNDFAMILGYPGRTDRYLTSFGVETAIKISNPTVVKVRDQKLAIIKEGMDKDPAVRLQYASKHSETSNYWKYFIGQTKGLVRLKIADNKRAEEQAFESWANADENRKAEYGSLISDFKNLYATYAKYVKPRTYFSEAVFQGPDILNLSFKMQGIEKILSNKEAKPEDLKAAVDAFKHTVEDHFSEYNIDIDRNLFAVLLKMHAEDIDAELLPQVYKDVQSKYKGNWKLYTDKVYASTMLASKTKMDAFLAKPSLKALQADPGYQAWTSIYSTHTEKVRGFTREFDAKLAELNKLWIRGLIEMQPTRKFYPDANSTMRFTYGSVQDYSPADAAHYNFITTADGLLQKDDQSNPDFALPARLKELIRKKEFGPYAENGNLPICFITNNDITGGNSGSPVINAKGELIGLAFDGNWEAMSGDIAFDKELKRTICMDARYILFMVDVYAGAKNIIQELKIVGDPTIIQNIGK